MPNKQEYLILGTNNFWYATLFSLDQVNDELKRIKEELKEEGDDETELYIYIATDITYQFNIKSNE